MSKPNRQTKPAFWLWAQRPAIWCWMALAWAAVGMGALWAQAPTNSGAKPQALPTQGAPSLRLSPLSAEMIEDTQSPVSDDTANLRREGTQIREERGHFEFNGDRVAFIATETKTRFIGLENLNLQRIAQILGGSADPLEWTVNGVVTEYQGTNFLLVTRATRATATSARRRSF